MNRKKIAIVEANMTGLQHAYPNGVYCSLISELYGKENISLHCSCEHLKAMKISNVYSEFKALQVVSDDNKMIQKFFVEMNNTFRIINETDADIIIFLSCFPEFPYVVLPSSFYFTKICLDFSYKLLQCHCVKYHTNLIFIR